MSSWYTGIYKALFISVIIAFIIGISSSGKTYVDAFIAVYSALILGILIVLITVLNGLSKQSTLTQSSFQSFTNLLLTTGPFILMLGVASFILYMMIYPKYNVAIVDERVSSGYYIFSSISLLLLFVQLGIIYSNISTVKFETDGTIPKVQLAVVLLLGVLSAISSSVVYIILKYYRTDGFRLIG